jgi:serine/threonine-protein kinase RsbW
MRVRTTLSLPRDRRSIGSLRRAVARALKASGAPSEVAADMELAVGELCANVVCHAESTSRYTVRVATVAGRGEVEVDDRPAEGQAPRLPSASAPDTACESGRGLPIVEALVDELKLEAGEELCWVRIAKHWRAAPPSAIGALASA